MRRTILSLLVLLLSVAAQAQRVTASFVDTPLPKVLEQLTLLQDDYEILAINNELEQFIITADIEDKTIPEALEQITAFYPIRCVINENVIHVEALRKQQIQYRGTVVGEDSIPLPYAKVTIYNPADSTLLQEAACSNAGVFVVPCTEPDVLIRFTHVAHDTLWVRPTQSDLGTIMLKEHDTQMEATTVVAPPWTGRMIKLSFNFVDSFTGHDIYLNDIKDIGLCHASDTAQKCPLVSAQTFSRGASEHCYLQFEIPARKDDYIVWFKAEGYELARMPYQVERVGRRTEIRVPPVRVRREVPKPEIEYVEDPDGDIIVEGKRMREVMITATKVKMYHKGDTIVYNADAFNLPDGSMLVDLLKAMPGVELNARGEIKVNGRKVDVLQLDGSDFLNSNTELLLQNLPHYTVEKVKVFEQDTEQARRVGAKSINKEYAMNVILKKQYKIGWLGNIELAGGLPTGKHDDVRYQARAFVTRFSEQSRLMISATSNNINNDASNRSESWSDNTSEEGLHRRNYVSLMYNVNDRQGRFDEKVYLHTKWSHHETESRQSALTYLQSGDTWARRRDTNTSNDFEAKLNNQFYLNKPFALKLWTWADYSHRESQGLSQSAQFNADPAAYGDVTSVLDSLMQNPFQQPGVARITLDKSRTQSLLRGNDYSFTQSVTYSKELNSGDYFSTQGVFTHSHQTSKDFNTYQLDYLNGTGANDLRNRYNLSPGHENGFSSFNEYNMNLKSGLGLLFEYAFNWEQKHKEQERYRLDQVSGWTADQALGMLPSTREHLLQGLDHGNSYTEDYYTISNRPKLTLSYGKERDGNLDKVKLILPVNIVYEHEHYQRHQLDTSYVRRSVLPEAWLNYEWKRNKEQDGKRRFEKTLQLTYDLSNRQPDIQSLLNIRDDYDPQRITLGGSDLKHQQNHKLSAHFERGKYTMRWEEITSQAFDVEYRRLQNAIATAYSFNPLTGVYTYRPTNINGNWEASAKVGHGHHLGKSLNFSYSVSANYAFRHNVDLIGGERSEVNSHTFIPSLSLRYMKASWDWQGVWLIGRWNWTRYQSPRAGFTTRTTLNHEYNLHAQYMLPAEIQFASDLMLYVRSGYDTPSLNTANWVWNASVSRSFWKKKLQFTLAGYDILQQINSITQDYNSQGRTETWVRSIPSYVMATLTYKFHVAPKEKK